MILYSNYNEKTRTDQVWYESSTVYYSKFIENETDNFGQLFVTFKNGSTYHYVDVDMVTHYILFKSGGIEMSHGKCLNKYIKPKYEYMRIDDIPISLLEEERNKLIVESTKDEIPDEMTVYFISGHRDITQEDFDKYYASEIKSIADNPENDDCLFIMGDYHGCDIMAQNYLLDTLNIKPNRVYVYHMFDKPRNVNPKVINLVGGFTSDEERDATMTQHSDYDIAFVYDHTKLSGTAQNILRRHLVNYTHINEGA